MKIISLVLLTLQLTQGQITIEPINNPLLPFHLGKAKITKYSHAFVKYIDLKIFHEPIKNFNHNLINLQSHVKTKDSLYPELSRVEDHARYLVNKVQNKLNIINPTRTKRGLLNIVGTGYKWAFGLLDHTDAERYDAAIKTLEKNQHYLHNDLKNLLTVTSNYMNETNNIVKNISLNQGEISKELINIQNNLNKYTFYLKLQNWLNNIIIDCQDIIEILDALETSILFAKLNILDNSLLSIKELKQIKNLINENYENGLIQFKQDLSYLEIIKTEVKRLGGKILLIFHVPIVENKLFDYYHLIPIPLHNQIIIPPKPYILVDSATHYYTEAPCPIIEGTCLHSVQPRRYTDDCIPTILQGNHANCKSLQYSNPTTIIEVINEAYLIVIPVIDITIKKQCEQNGFAEISSPHLVHLPQNCQVTISNQTFDNRATNLIGTPIEMMTMETTPLLSTRNSPLVLHSIQTDKLTDIYNHAQQIHVTDLEEITQNRPDNTLLYILTILIVIILFYMLYKYFLRNKETILKIFVKTRKSPPESEVLKENKTNPLFSI